MPNVTTAVRRARLLLVVAAVTTACSDAATAPVDPAPVSVTIASPGLIRDGDVVQLSATARSTSGAVVPGVTLQWSVTDTTVATITDAGVFTALREGSTEVAARTMTGGRLIEQRLTVPVVLHPATALDVNAAVIEVPLATTARVGTTLRGLDGRILRNRPLTWTSDDPTIVRVEADGALVPVSGGVTMVRVHYGTLSATVQVRVPPASAVYGVAEVNGRALPAVVEEFTADEAGGPQRYQVRLESGTITLGSTYRIALQVATYRVSELQGNVIVQLAGRTTVTDTGTVTYNWLTGDATLQSTLFGGLVHPVSITAAGPDIQFRLPGTTTIWTLGARLRN